jgi:hypothetical protein
MNNLNNKGKNLSLCKFIETGKKEDIIYVYAFGQKFIERVNMNKPVFDPKWEELNIKIKEPLPLLAHSF